jgi:hypothetical protein
MTSTTLKGIRRRGGSICFVPVTCARSRAHVATSCSPFSLGDGQCEECPLWRQSPYREIARGQIQHTMGARPRPRSQSPNPIPNFLKANGDARSTDFVKQGTVEGATKAFGLWLQRVHAIPLKRAVPLSCGTASPQRRRSTTSRGGSRLSSGSRWTLMPNGDSLHRNVIFRVGKDKADQIVPVSAYGWRIRLQSCRVEFLTT